MLRVQIENQDFRKLIPGYDGPDTLFYLDPPYVPQTRRSGGYAHELSLDDHHELVGILLGLKGMAILSGYAHPVYKPLEKAGWRKRSWRTVCSAAGCTKTSGLKGQGKLTAKQGRIECVWISPSAQAKRRKRNVGT
jgi:DNA adenine methylase